MNLRRQKLQSWIALQASAAVAADTNRDHPISDLSVWGLREPTSSRSYTVVRVRTRSGLTGYGEATAPVQPHDVEKARALLTGKPATAYQVLRTETPLD